MLKYLFVFTIQKYIEHITIYITVVKLIPAIGVCPESYIYNPHEDTCFRLVETLMTWEDADKTCRDADEYLVTFSTAASSQWFRAKAVELSANNSGKNNRFIVFLLA